MNKEKKISLIFLAGGVGKRMRAPLPKQYMYLESKTIVSYSFELFLSMDEIDEIIVVCASDFKSMFKLQGTKKRILFAQPGARRQDSVYNGFQFASHELICIHDAVRPFISRELVLKVLENGDRWGAAALGMPVKSTIKEVNGELFVNNTLNRSHIWEIQTPQVLHRDILEKGFSYAIEHNITVTDDVSFAELIGKQVKLVESTSLNFKITTPEDLLAAKHFLQFI